MFLPPELIDHIVSFVYDDIDIRRAMNKYGKIRRDHITYTLLEKWARKLVLNTFKMDGRTMFRIPNHLHIPDRASKKVLDDKIIFRAKDFSDQTYFGGGFMLYEFMMYRLKQKTGTNRQESIDTLFKADYDDCYWEIIHSIYKLYPVNK